MKNPSGVDQERSTTEKPRDFGSDFCLPALSGLNRKEAARVALALDAAILFGVLEYAEGNTSLQDLGAVRKRYAEKVARLNGAH
jgi:hypothetical protein